MTGTNDLADLCGDSIDEVLESYKEYLLVKAPEHFKAMERREKSNPEGAMFEAAMFAVMRGYYDFDVSVAERADQGGADFLCRSDAVKFMLEVTALDTQSVEDVSGLPHKLTPGEARFFAPLTHKLRQKASDKAAQLSGYPMPRVLAFGLFHSSQALFSKLQAEWLLYSEPKIVVRVGDADAPAYQETDLDDSVFFRKDKAGDAVISCRQSISAILLVSMGCREGDFSGILHPEPKFVFDYRLLPDIPFVRIANWPLTGGHDIQTEWVVADPEPRKKWLSKVKFKESELRQL